MDKKLIRIIVREALEDRSNGFQAIAREKMNWADSENDGSDPVIDALIESAWKEVNGK